MDKNTLIAQANTLLPDNTAGEISPSDVRTVSVSSIDANLNLNELAEQVVDGPIDFLLNPSVAGADMLQDAPADTGLYVRRDGEWVQKASFVATSNSTFTVSGSAVTPSFLPFDVVSNPSGIAVENALEGTIRNVTGRTIKSMTGTISFNPDKSGGGSSRVIVISERTTGGGTVWEGNLNSIRNVEISGTTESFGTKVSLVTDWADNELLRFRAYEVGGGSVDFKAEAETILGQAFTGPSLVWDLSEH